MRRRDELLLRYLLATQENQSPHALAYTRRQFFKRSGQFAVSASALAAFLAACGGDDDDDDGGTTATSNTGGGGGATATATSGTGGGGASTPAGTPGGSGGATGELPEVTEIPEALKGSGEVRVVSYGGAFQEAQRRAYFEPFERLSGIKVIDTEGPSVAAIKAQVDTGNIEWDIAQTSRASVMELEAAGDYVEPIDYDLVDTDNILEAFRYPTALDMLPFAQIYAYRTDAGFSETPSGWADFWDVETFPGPRTMPGGGTLSPDLEAAVMAAGVAVSDVYPIDIDLAFESMEKIRDDVVRWWDAGAIPAQMLTDNEVTMGTAWNGRIAAIQDQGAPVEIAWNQGTLINDAWAILKGSPNLENAQKFIAFITMPIPQARLSMLIPYGFVNSAAAEYIPENVLDRLPTAPHNLEQLLIFDTAWWAENRPEVIERWNEFLLG